MPAIRRISLTYVFQLALILSAASLSRNNGDENDTEESLSSTSTTTTVAPATISSVMRTVESLTPPPMVLIHNERNSNPNCPSNIECNRLGFPCIDCQYNSSCLYGEDLNVTCTSNVDCIGNKTFLRSMTCRYCYQTDAHKEHSCLPKANCLSKASPRHHYRANCTVRSEVLCMGRREFNKNVRCNWTGGYKWSTALILSITLGGFGADRFYLGHWQEGIGKLFSFGGLGVWTLVDVVLIWLHYLGPADGSLYI